MSQRESTIVDTLEQFDQYDPVRLTIGDDTIVLNVRIEEMHVRDDGCVEAHFSTERGWEIMEGRLTDERSGPFTLYREVLPATEPHDEWVPVGEVTAVGPADDAVPAWTQVHGDNEVADP